MSELCCRGVPEGWSVNEDTSLMYCYDMPLSTSPIRIYTIQLTNMATHRQDHPRITHKHGNSQTGPPWDYSQTWQLTDRTTPGLLTNIATHRQDHPRISHKHDNSQTRPPWDYSQTRLPWVRGLRYVALTQNSTKGLLSLRSWCCIQTTRTI